MTRLEYDGLAMIAEYDASGNIVRRYVRGDPVNYTDPLGLEEDEDSERCDDNAKDDNDDGLCGSTIVVTPGIFNQGGGATAGGFGYSGSGRKNGDQFVIVVQSGVPYYLKAGQAHPSVVIVTADRPQRDNKPCEAGTAATIAEWAEKISVGSGAVAVGAGALGLATAPTGAGFVAFESVAVVAGGVSVVASGVGAIARFANGDYVGAALDAGGIAGGALAGKVAGNALKSSRMFGNLSASQARQVNLANNGAGTAAGAASSLYSCR